MCVPGATATHMSVSPSDMDVLHVILQSVFDMYTGRRKCILEAGVATFSISEYISTAFCKNVCAGERVPPPYENWLTDLPTGQDENEIFIQEAKPQIEGEICLNEDPKGVVDS